MRALPGQQARSCRDYLGLSKRWRRHAPCAARGRPRQCRRVGIPGRSAGAGCTALPAGTVEPATKQPFRSSRHACGGHARRNTSMWRPVGLVRHLRRSQHRPARATIRAIASSERYFFFFFFYYPKTHQRVSALLDIQGCERQCPPEAHAERSRGLSRLRQGGGGILRPQAVEGGAMWLATRTSTRDFTTPTARSSSAPTKPKAPADDDRCGEDDQIYHRTTARRDTGRTEARPYRRYAARTVARNFSTSALSRVLSPDSDCAEDSTWVEAVPVSLAPRLTSPMLAATWAVPLRGLLHVAGDLLVGGALLLDRGRNRRGDFGNAADRAADLLDGADRILRRRLHPGDLRADLVGRLARSGRRAP